MSEDQMKNAYSAPTIVVVGSVKDLTRGLKTKGKVDTSPIPNNVS